MKHKVPFVDFPATFRLLDAELMEAVRKVLSTGQFILRGEVEAFESGISHYLEVPHTISVNSGTDALYLALLPLNLEPGDEVITVSHTFVATIGAIVRAGAKPVLADLDSEFNMDPESLAAAITPRTRAIIVVHQNGRACRMDQILDICRPRGIQVIEDVALAMGTKFDGRFAGSFGFAGCFSTHPMKTFGGAGDGGFITTFDANLDERLRLLRNNGQKTKDDIVLFGMNSRLDDLQAAILNVKLRHLDSFIRRRREIAARYQTSLQSLEALTLPPSPDSDPRYFDTYNHYVIRARNIEERDRLLQSLLDDGIEVFVHRRRPVHLQPDLGLSHFHLPRTVDTCNRMISLPIFETMSDEQVDTVVTSIRKFYA